MDEVLKGTFSSNYPQDLKLAVIDRIVESVHAIEDKDAINNILKVCFNIIVNSKTDFDVSMTKRVLTAYTRAHPNEVSKFFYQKLTLAVEHGLFQQDEISEEKSVLLELIPHVLSLLRSSNTDNHFAQGILKSTVSCFLVEKSVYICAMLAEVLIQNWKEDIIVQKESDLIDKMIKMLCKFSLKVDSKTTGSPVQEISKRVCQANILSSLFSKIIGMNEKYVHFALKEIFMTMCQNDSPSSITMVPLLTSIPQKYAKFAAEAICGNQMIKDVNIDRVLCKLIDWLVWPASQKLDAWIITLCKTLLADRRRHTLVADIIKKKAVVVFNHMFCEVSRESALAVFSFMMMAYQHSPEIFHKVVPRFPSLFSLVEKDPKSSKEVLKLLAELAYTLVYIFPGYSDAYSDLLSAVKNYPQPSIADMKRWMLGSSVIKQDGSTLQIGSEQFRKPFFGKTGLINLGNTCYMNSVIQALYMLKSLRSKLLSMPLTATTEPLTYNLAKLFAFLLLSERPAISPNDFYRASRPPWFRPGAQQDCSEFLKHLIDILEREDKLRCDRQGNGDSCKTSNPKVNELFTGECKVDVKCMNCSAVSSRFEAFTDVPLAFPNAIDNQEREFSLKGGDISRGLSKAVSGNLSESEKKDVIETKKSSELSQPSMTFTFHSPRDLKDVQPPISEEKPLNLQDLLHSYLSTEMLHGQNQYRCDNCSSLQDAEQTHFLTKCPKYLILTLKRFTYNAKTHTRGKIMQNVQFPYILTVPNLIQTVNEQDSDNTAEIPLMRQECEMEVDSTSLDEECSNGGIESFKKTLPSISCKPVMRMNDAENKSYCLVSVIVHAGVSSESGHYYCYSRKNVSRPSERQLESRNVGPIDSTLDRSEGGSLPENTVYYSSTDVLGDDVNESVLKDDWYLFNDSLVTRVKAADLEKIQSNHPRDTPYVFIYEESCTDSPASTEEESEGLWTLEVESDNIEFRKDQRMTKRPLTDVLWQSKSRKWDEDRNDDSGGGSYGNCGGGFSSLGSNAGRFIY